MATAQQWKIWVTRWKASGSTAPAFAAKHGLNSQELYNWAYRLRLTGKLTTKPRATAKSIRLLRVIPRRKSGPTSDAPGPASPIRLTVAGASIEVQAGVDEFTLRKVLAALKAVQEEAR